ncbi:patatin-like protein [Bradyrhizobium sp.]|uniref:patatin-like protein n=1 Tax=Bradyrhizobium sp. TaxID=376 RepID=UPI001D2F5DB5|nr:patatin-like protein [Bradyrhizobium sp.]MBI5319028.1 patatin-like protein [Bradyrhizobium sp.]
MREKELRVALVCFGGASLAIYMHGITKEILKLVRASGALHAIADRNKRSTADFFDVRNRADPEYDTESIYFDLLRDIGRTVDLRVIVDIVAGASAGGINGIMLARALSHDLPMRRLRDLWLENADVTELLASEAKAHVSSKWFLRPLFWVAGLAGLGAVSDLEVRSKLSLFVRSRWFEPPFDGPKMTALMYNAVAAMGAGEKSSLLPSGQGLDLFVTLTDFNGYQRTMQIHNPPVIHEREHRHRLHFRYRRRPSGAVESDFEMVNAPALAFAARATSSIPGAFPPARIVEVDEFLRRRSIDWPRRADFIARNFDNYARMNVDVASVPFIDGSVLSSHPFREAVGAIRGRAAYREVDRRVVYVDPNPTPVGSAAHHGMPGFFPTLKGALSEIPLSQPVTDELGWVGQFNEQVRRLRAIVDSARPHVRRLVGEVIAIDHEQPVSEDRIRGWREQANIRAARDAGFAYDAYVRLKLASARDFVSRLIMEIRGVHPESPFARAITEIMNAWAVESGVTYDPAAGKSSAVEGAEGSDNTPKWVAFLLAFDVDYRMRRLRFLIEGQNRISQMLGSGAFEGLDFAVVDRLKRRFYECTEALERRETAAAVNSAARDLVEDIFRMGPSPAEAREIGKYAQSFAVRHKDRIDALIERLALDIDLKASTSDIDVLLAETEGWPPLAMRELLVNYLGFPFWDIVTFPIMPWREAGEFNEVRIDRISAQDAVGINRLGEFRLKGTGFSQSAAFLSRAYRENDYLLGRLHAVDRLIDIVSEAAGPDSQSPAVIAALKRRGFLRILDAEERHLPACRQLVEKLRAALMAEGTA